MKLQQILLFLFILSISSCKNNNNADKESILNTIKINSNKLQEEGYLSSLVKDFQIVPLETNDSSLILDIRKVICYKNYIYILDKSTFRLLLFENNGKFIKQIGKRGQGPGEYLELLDFTIDTIGDRLLLADYRNLLAFTIEGSFIDSYRLDFVAPYINILPDGDLFFYGADEHKLIISDNIGKVIKEEFTINSIFNQIPNSYNLTNNNKGGLIHLPGNDTIFSINNQIVSPYYFLDFGKHQFGNKDLDKLSTKQRPDFRDYLLNDCDCIICDGFLPSKEYIYIQLMYSGDFYSGFYNKKNKKSLFIDRNNINNDLFNCFFYINPVGVTSDEYIATIPAYKLTGLIDDSSMFKHIINYDLFKKLDENSNPTLIFYKPKI